MNPIAILKTVFTLVGLILLAGGFYWQQHSQSFLTGAIRAEGTVIDFKISGSKSIYYPKVRFTTNEGEVIEFTSSSGSRPPDYAKGERVEVLYPSAAPHQARINDFLSLWLGPLILGGIGAGFTLFGALLLLYARRLS